MPSDFEFHIDVVGACNLRCPSCPVGNWREVKNPQGFMKPELLRQILRKATAACNVVGVCLFNWTEPLLHPHLPELVDMVRSFNIPCHLSSNLNIAKNIDAVLAADPTSFFISTSAFTQELYGFTHRGGEIDMVKRNMEALAGIKQRLGSTTSITVVYHRYIGNLDDELRMKDFAKALGFQFVPVWACMMPLEKGLAYVTGNMPDVRLTEEDLDLIQRLALPIPEAVKASQKYKHRPCILRDRRMTLDFHGIVQLCCGTYDASKYSLGPYLTSSHDELQALKHSHPLCKKCMENGMHVYGVYGASKLDKIGKSNMYRYYRDGGVDFFQGIDKAAFLHSTRISVVRALKDRLRPVRDVLRGMLSSRIARKQTS